MFRHSTDTASFFSVLSAALIFSLCLAGVAAAQVNNTSLGTAALQNNTTGSFNTASGFVALFSNTTGSFNTATGADALLLTRRDKSTLPAESVRSVVTPQATTTPQTEKGLFSPTPPATIIPLSGPTPMYLLGI